MNDQFYDLDDNFIDDEENRPQEELCTEFRNQETSETRNQPEQRE